MTQLTAKKIKQLEKRMVPIDAASPHINILIYGQNGSQKTRFGASAPMPLIIDVNEKGTKSARQFRDALVFNAKKWEDIPYLYWYLREVEHDRESVVIDNLTTLQQMCMSHVLGESADRDPNKDPAIASMRDWGKVTELMKPLLLNLRNLPMHVVFIAQERVVEDDEEETMHMPDLPRGIRGIATGAVDIIGRTYQTEVRRGNKKKKTSETAWEPRMLVGPHDSYVTKDRTGQLPRIVRRPTVPMFIEAASHLDEE